MILHTPGRLVLFGAHSDWAAIESDIQGRCIALTTTQFISAAVKRAPNRLITSPGFATREAIKTTHPGDPLDIPLAHHTLQNTARGGGFWSYVAGSVLAFEDTYPNQNTGLHLDFQLSTLPIKKGLSSSAAVCVLTIRALAHHAGLKPSEREVMELAYLGERMTGSGCGRLDQIVAYKSGAYTLLFEGNSVDVTPLKTGGSFQFLLVDLNGNKDTQRILKDLTRSFTDPNHLNHKDSRHYFGNLNPQIHAEATHLLETGKQVALGALMTESLALFDRYVSPACPSQLKSPKLHHLLKDPGLKPFIFGGKGVGSHGDGSAQLLCRSPSHRDAAIEYLQTHHKMNALPLDLGID